MLLHTCLKAFCSSMVLGLEPRAVCTTGKSPTTVLPFKLDSHSLKHQQTRHGGLTFHAFYLQGHCSQEERHTNSCLNWHLQAHALHPGAPAEGHFLRSPGTSTWPSYCSLPVFLASTVIAAPGQDWWGLETGREWRTVHRPCSSSHSNFPNRCNYIWVLQRMRSYVLFLYSSFYKWVSL